MPVQKSKILIATTNPGKFAEIISNIDLHVDWLSLADFEGISQIEEDGLSFAENARKKALGYAGLTGLTSLADDSGLVVDALGGAPGVRSARFGGEKSEGLDRKTIDQHNIAKVLKLLQDVPKEKRTAKFVCCLCLASPQKILLETRGELEGLLIDKQMGQNGFGYDPIFIVPSLNKTVAQLTNEQKNEISHRGRAIRKLKPLLKKLLANTKNK
jgi:XTP/dITP diphosphohydrolase